MATEAEAIAEELDTIGARIRWLIGKYGQDIPDLHEDYTLVELLYFDEFLLPKRMPAGYQGMRGALRWLIDEALEGNLPSVLSIHRAQTIVKKDYESPEQRRRSMERDLAWGKAVAWSETGDPDG